jgi:FMN phosphatase YigB (HAD superfamily)
MSRIVAFDLGGVLVDVAKDHLDGFGDAFFGDRHDALSTGGLDADAWVAAVASDVDESADVVRAAWQRVVRWSPGALGLLQATALRGPLRVWSNTDPIHWQVLQEKLVGAFDPRAFDDVATLSFRCGFMKPDPRFYAAALGNDDPGDVLLLDDRKENVAAACAVGIDAVVVHGVAEAAAAIARR